MIRRSTLVLLVIFILLVAGAVIWQRMQDKKSTETTTTPTPGSQLLFNFKGSITGLHLERTSGGVLELSKDAQGAWQLVNPKAEATDATVVDTAVSQLISTPIVSTLEIGPSMEAAGLARPAYRLSISLDDGSQEVVYIGNATPTGSGYYVLVSEQGKAAGGITIASKYSLDPLLNLLDNPPILPTATPTTEATTQIAPEAPVTATP